MNLAERVLAVRNREAQELADRAELEAFRAQSDAEHVDTVDATVIPEEVVTGAVLDSESTDKVVAEDDADNSEPSLSEGIDNNVGEPGGLSEEDAQREQRRKLRRFFHTVRQTTDSLPEGTTPKDRFEAVSAALTSVGLPIESTMTSPAKFWASVKEKRVQLQKLDAQFGDDRKGSRPSVSSSKAAPVKTGTEPKPVDTEPMGTDTIDPVYAGAEDAAERIEQAKKDRHIARGHAAVADLVKFDANYMGHWVGNASDRHRQGSFMKMSEVDDIAAHQDIVRHYLNDPVFAEERRVEFAQHKADKKAEASAADNAGRLPTSDTNATPLSIVYPDNRPGDRITFWNSPGAYLGGKMAEAGAWLRMPRTPEQKRNGKIIAGVLGAAALVGTFMAIKYGIDHNSALSQVPTPKIPKNEFGIDFSKASKAALTVHKGEGIYETFEELGIPKSKWHKALVEYGPKLVKKGLAYRDESIGGFGWDRAMKLTAKQLQSIFNK